MFPPTAFLSQFQKTFTIKCDGYITSSFINRISISIAIGWQLCFRCGLGIATSLLVASVPRKCVKRFFCIKSAISERDWIASSLWAIAILFIPNIAKEWMHCTAMEFRFKGLGATCFNSSRDLLWIDS